MAKKTAKKAGKKAATEGNPMVLTAGPYVIPRAKKDCRGTVELVIPRAKKDCRGTAELVIPRAKKSCSLRVKKG